MIFLDRFCIVSSIWHGAVTAAGENAPALRQLRSLGDSRALSNSAASIIRSGQVYYSAKV
jgi:hypothetical protein